MTSKAPVKATTNDTTPTGGWWFTLHVSNSNWLQDNRFRTVCDFEGSNHFADPGINLRVLNHGPPTSFVYCISNMIHVHQLISVITEPLLTSTGNTIGK